MTTRKLMVLPMLAGALALGACEAEEEPAIDPVDPVVEPAVDPVDAPLEAAVPGVEGAEEVLGNGIDDDADGLIDEEP